MGMGKSSKKKPMTKKERKEKKKKRREKRWTYSFLYACVRKPYDVYRSQLWIQTSLALKLSCTLPFLQRQTRSLQF
jgi:hypothetical protein